MIPQSSPRSTSTSRSGHAPRPVVGALAGAFLLLPLATGAAAQTPEERLAELGIELPTPDAPTANFVKAVTTGNLVFLAGHGPCGGLDETNTGKVGLDHTVEEGYEIARWVGICLLASLAREIGDLSRVKRIVRVFGMVNTPPDFTQHSQVINGCSDLMEQVFGPAISKHARAAVGMASLPRDQSVEIEMLVELHDP